MKKTQISVSLILALALCFSVSAQTENTSGTTTKRKTNSFISANIEVPILVGNSKFRDFMSENFDMHTPNAMFGAGLSVGSNFSSSKRWLWEYGVSARASFRSENNITRNWTQMYMPLRFSYAIIDNKSFQLSPFAGISFTTNTLNYSDMRTIGDKDKITEILETDFTSFNLSQMSTGFEFGLFFDFIVDDPTHRRNPMFSVFIKWEQSFWNDNWMLEKFRIRDIPKFENNALSIGILTRI
jgi:hypothetical protein